MFKIMIIKGEMHIQHTLEMSHHCTNRDLNQHLQKKNKKKTVESGARVKVGAVHLMPRSKMSL